VATHFVAASSMKLDRFLYSRYYCGSNFYESIFIWPYPSDYKESVDSRKENRCSCRHRQRQPEIRGQFVDRLCSLTWRRFV